MTAAEPAPRAAPAPNTMLALTADALGPPDIYRLERRPIREPGPGEVRLRVEAVALGFVDALIAAGGYQHRPVPPYVPGAEIAGVVDRLGPDVAGVAVGDRVASWQLLAGGGAAEFAIAPRAALVPVPDRLGLVTAASLLLDQLTAWHALFDRGGLTAGETVLVLGAAGGVGATAVQIAAGAGACVIAAASTAEKRARAIALGAAAAVDYQAPDWRDAVRGVAPGGVDIVVDPVGGPTFEPAFRSLTKGGRHLILGFASGDVPRLPANLPLLKSGALIGADARHLFETDLAHALTISRTIFDRAAEGLLRPPETDVYSLEAACAALVAVAGREKRRKIVIVPTARGGLPARDRAEARAPIIGAP